MVSGGEVWSLVAEVGDPTNTESKSIESDPIGLIREKGGRLYLLYLVTYTRYTF